MIGRLLARLFRVEPYTDDVHAETLAAISEVAERMVGTCSTCGEAMRLARDPTRALCGCGEAIPPEFFPINERRRP
jgi:hypothetical protein